MGRLEGFRTRHRRHSGKVDCASTWSGIIVLACEVRTWLLYGRKHCAAQLLARLLFDDLPENSPELDRGTDIICGDALFTGSIYDSHVKQ